MRKIRSTTVIAICLLALLSNFAKAGDCNEILRMGFYDYFREAGMASKSSEIESEVCSAYEEAKQRRSRGEVSTSYAIFSGAARISWENLEYQYKAMCDRERINDLAKEDVVRNIRTVNQNSVRAWEECNKTQSAIIMSLTISDDMAKVASISVRRNVQEGAEDRNLVIDKLVVVPRDAFRCTGTIRGGVTLRNGSPGTITCVRNIYSAPISVADKKWWAVAAMVTINSRNGSLSIPFAAIPVSEPPPPTDVPIGAVAAYAGPETTIPSGWLLCNGRAVRRSEYQQLFQAIGPSHGHGDNVSTFNLPDFRGRFLRGADGGSSRDPDRDKRIASNAGGNMGANVGSIQDDAFVKHTHQLRTRESTKGTTGTPVSGDGGGVWTSGWNTAESGTSDETRPKNVYVNYIIRAR